MDLYGSTCPTTPGSMDGYADCVTDFAARGKLGRWERVADENIVAKKEDINFPHGN